MLRHFLPVILITSILFISCKKGDAVAGDNTSANSNNSSNIVYNVNKATLLQLVNDIRTKGCTCGTTAMPPVAKLVWNDQLAKAGYDHSVDMKTNNYFSHTGLDGSTPGQRIKAAGYQWNSYGENIAIGYPTEQDVMNGWLNSEGHCKNIMSGLFKDIGVGEDGNYWTQEFGTK